MCVGVELGLWVCRGLGGVWGGGACRGDSTCRRGAWTPIGRDADRDGARLRWTDGSRVSGLSAYVWEAVLCCRPLVALYFIWGEGGDVGARRSSRLSRPAPGSLIAQNFCDTPTADATPHDFPLPSHLPRPCLWTWLTGPTGTFDYV